MVEKSFPQFYQVYNQEFHKKKKNFMLGSIRQQTNALESNAP